MLDRAFRLSLTGPTFLKNAIVSTRFIAVKATEQPVPSPTENNSPEPVRVVLPFKDQASADILRTQLKDLSQKINTTIQLTNRRQFSMVYTLLLKTGSLYNAFPGI